MKIAQIAPLVESVPPALYGGTERVVSYLTEELVGQGHEVTLFASGDSRTSAELVSVMPRALRLDARVRDYHPYCYILLDKVLERAHDFDILHFHVDMFHFPALRLISTPAITTLHGRLDLPDNCTFYQAFTDFPLVSISDAQRVPMPTDTNWVATIQHGLPPNLFRCSSSPCDYFAFLGRISPEKGPERAIEIAKRAGVRLIIAAKVDVVDRLYFEEKVRPLMDDPLVEFVGEIGGAQKNALLAGARALLFPIDWPEPFGLVMIEAMACGTPVIAFNRGSVAEILDEGETGFLVDSVEEAVQAVHRVDALDRGSVRRRFEERFTVDHMARNYVAAYRQVLQGGRASIAA